MKIKKDPLSPHDRLFERVKRQTFGGKPLSYLKDLDVCRVMRRAAENRFKAAGGSDQAFEAAFKRFQNRHGIKEKRL